MKAKGLTDALLRHKKVALVVGGSNAVAALGTLYSSRLLTELAPPEVFGEYKLALAAVSLGTGLLIRPLTQFLMREYHDAAEAKQLPAFLGHARKTLRNYILLLGLGLLLAGEIFYFHWDLGGSLLLLGIVGVFVSRSRFETLRALLITANEQTPASSARVLQSWLVPTGIGLGLWLFAKHSVIMLGATILVAFFLERWLGQRLTQLADNHSEGARLYAGSRGFTQRALKYGAPLVGTGVLGWIVHESDRFFLSYFHDDAAVGVYAAAYGVVSAPFALVVGTLSQLIYPLAFKASSQNDEKKEKRLMIVMLGIASAISVIGVGAVALLHREIAFVALGEVYRDSASPLMIWISAGYAFHSMATVFDVVAYGRRTTGDMVVGYGCSAATNFALNYLLIPSLGAHGAAIATFFSLLIYFVTMASLYLARESTQRRGLPCNSSRDV